MSRPRLIPDDAPPPPRRVVAGDPAEEMARSIWASAAPAGVRAMEALAAMITNRARHLGVPPAQVARDGDLFACRRPQHPLHAILDAADSRNPTYAMALRIARRALAAGPGGDDPSQGATRFHAGGDMPDWAAGLAPLIDIGGLLFYGEDNAG